MSIERTKEDIERFREDMKRIAKTEQAAKIEAFPEYMKRYIDWNVVMKEFLGIWPRIVIESQPGGPVLVRAYNEISNSAKKEE